MKKTKAILIKIGDILNKVTNPIIMFIVYLFLFIPIGLFLKLINKDILDKKINKNKKTYWNTRANSISSMKDQF